MAKICNDHMYPDDPKRDESYTQTKQEQLQRLGSEDTPCRIMITHTIDLYWIPSQQVKWRQNLNYKFNEFARISKFLKKKKIHATYLLKLLDKMCNYEIDLASIVEDAERTRFCPQTDRRTDKQTDRRTRWNQYTPFQLRWSGNDEWACLINQN